MTRPTARARPDERRRPSPRGLEPGQNLPAPRPPAEPAPVERFSASPSVLANELSPERAARIVRQSSNARWVGFLTVIVVILFTAIYWFYEVGRAARDLGAPARRRARPPSRSPRSSAATTSSRPTAPAATASTARAASGRPSTARTSCSRISTRTTCAPCSRPAAATSAATPNSLMPVWSNLSNPPGPLNYVQIDDLIAFLRATNDVHLHVRDAELGTTLKDPLTGKVKTFTGWRDPNYQPAPDATPYPACWKSEFAAVSGARRPRAARARRPHPSASASAARPRRGRRGRERRRLDRGLGHRVHDAQRDRAGQHGLPDRLRQRGRERPAQRRDQGRRRHRALQGRGLRGRRDQDVRRAGPRTRARTPSTARSTPT